MAPEKNGAMEFIKFASENGVTVSAGHTDATFEDVEYAMEEVEDMKNDVEYSLFNMPSNILLQDRAEALEECLDELEAIDTYEDEEDEDEDTNAGLGYNYRTDILSALQILI